MSECCENCNCEQKCETVTETTEVLTEVTSVAKEEEKTGQQVQMPTAEEVVNRAGASFISNMNRLMGVIKARNGSSYRISRKGMNRVMNAILSLPTDGIPVKLEGDEEKMAFALGQRLIADRFILLQHFISTEMKKQKEKEELEKQQAYEEQNKALENNKETDNPNMDSTIV